MSIRNERKGREALQHLSGLRDQSGEEKEFDAAIGALDTLINEYNGFDTSLVLINRLTNHVLDEEDKLRAEGAPIGLRFGKLLAAIADINYATRQENAKQGPMRPNIAALEEGE